MSDDLHWLAFRYVCGEMAADEEESFERRLAEEQRAREAVAEAVELHAGIRDVAPGLRSSRSRAAGRGWLWRAAACLLLAGGLMWLISGSQDKPGAPPGVQISQGDTPAAEEVALTWAEIQRQPRGDADGLEAAPIPEAGPAEEAMSGKAGVPEWMVIVFSDEARRTKGRH